MTHPELVARRRWSLRHIAPALLPLLAVATPAWCASPQGGITFAWVPQTAPQAGPTLFGNSNNCEGAVTPGTMMVIGHNFPGLGASVCATTPDSYSGVVQIGSFIPRQPILPLLFNSGLVLGVTQNGTVGGDFNQGQASLYAYAQGKKFGIYVPQFFVFDDPPEQRQPQTPPGFSVGIVAGGLQATNNGTTTFTNLPVGVALAINADSSQAAPGSYAAFGAEVSISLISPAGVQGPIIAAPFVSLGFTNAPAVLPFQDAGFVTPPGLGVPLNCNVPADACVRAGPLNGGASAYGVATYPVTVPPGWTVAIALTLTGASDPGFRITETSLPAGVDAPAGGGGATNVPTFEESDAPLPTWSTLLLGSLLLGVGTFFARRRSEA